MTISKKNKEAVMDFVKAMTEYKNGTSFPESVGNRCLGVKGFAENVYFHPHYKFEIGQCENCGKDYRKTRSDKIFCGTSCRGQYNRNNKE